MPFFLSLRNSADYTGRAVRWVEFFPPPLFLWSRPPFPLLFLPVKDHMRGDRQYGKADTAPQFGPPSPLPSSVRVMFEKGRWRYFFLPSSSLVCRKKCESEQFLFLFFLFRMPACCWKVKESSLLFSSFLVVIRQPKVRASPFPAIEYEEMMKKDPSFPLLSSVRPMMKGGNEVKLFSPLFCSRDGDEGRKKPHFPSFLPPSPPLVRGRNKEGKGDQLLFPPPSRHRHSAR